MSSSVSSNNNENNSRIPNYFYVKDRSFSGTALWFSISSLVTVVSFFLYEFLRRRQVLKRILYTRLHAAINETPPYPSKFFGWIKVAINTDENYIIENVGLDGAMFLRFLKSCFQLALLLCIVQVPVLVPVNYHSSSDTFAIKTNVNGTDTYVNVGNEALDKFSIANYPSGSNLLYLHVFYGYFMTLVIFFLFHKEYKLYAQIASEYLKENGILARKASSWRKGERLQLRTIMIDSVPDDIRCDAKLKDWFTSLGIGAVSVAYVDRLIGKEVQKIFDEREQVLNALEKAYVSWCHRIDMEVDKKVSKNMKFFQKLKYKLFEKRTHHHPPHPSDQERHLENYVVLDYETLHNCRPTMLLPFTSFGKNRLHRLSLKPIKFIHQHSNSNHVSKNNPSSSHLLEEHDTIDFLTNKLILLTERLKQQRYLALEPVLYRQPNKVLCGSTAFVTFKTQRAAQIAAQVLLHSDPNPVTLRIKAAPAPQDIIWQSLSRSAFRTYFSRHLVTVISVILCFFVAVPTTALSSLVSIENLATIDSFKETVIYIERHRFLLLLIQTVLPQIIVGLMNYLVIPFVLQFLSYHQGYRSHSRVEMATMSKYFSFLFFNVFFVFTIASTAWKLVSGLVTDPFEVVRLISQSLPSGADFFINYIIYNIMFFSYELCRFGPLIYGLVMETFFIKTPRQVHRNSLFSSYLDYGMLYPLHVLIFVIMICYAVLAPLILVPGLFYFGIAWVIYKNQLLFVYVKEWESFGRHWNMTFKRCMIGVGVFQLTLISVLVSKGGNHFI